MWAFLVKLGVLDLKERRSVHCWETVNADDALSDYESIQWCFCCCADDGGGGGCRGMLDHEDCLAKKDHGEPLGKMVKEAQWERKAI